MTQGDYDMVTNHGIDFDCKSSTNTNQNENVAANEVKYERKRVDTIPSIGSMTLSSESLCVESATFDLNEKCELMKKLEISSKGTIQGSLLLNYLKSSKMPFSLMFLLVLFLLTQALVNLSDVWVSLW